MPGVTRLAVAAFVLVAACSGTADPGDISGPDLRQRALEFAVTADRALAGTRFEGVPADALVDALESICTSAGGFDDAVFAAVSGLPAGAGEPGDGAVAAEVLVAGVVEVCPERVGAVDVMSRYLAAVLAAVDTDDLDTVAVMEAGPAVCRALDEGSGPEGSLLRAVEVLFGIVASSYEHLTDAGLTVDQAVVVGAALASAVEHLCPQHREAVMEFVDTLG
jgi:hypothetical protein